MCVCVCECVSVCVCVCVCVCPQLELRFICLHAAASEEFSSAGVVLLTPQMTDTVPCFITS